MVLEERANRLAFVHAVARGKIVRYRVLQPCGRPEGVQHGVSAGAVDDHDQRDGDHRDALAQQAP